MKKIIAIVLSAALILALGAGLTVNADGVVKTLDSYAPVAMSFDTFFVNGEIMQNGEAFKWLDENLGADRYYDNSQNTVYTIGIRGWIGFDQEIECFGYQVNDGTVYFGIFGEATEPGVIAAGGEHAQRFNIEIPVNAFAGESKFAAAAKLADGTVVALTSASNTGHNTAVTIKNPNYEIIKDADIEDFADAAQHYDYVLWNGSILNGTGTPEQVLPTYLNADGALDAIENNVSYITFYGWTCCSSSPIADVGFAIDDEVHFESVLKTSAYGITFKTDKSEDDITDHLVNNMGWDEDDAATNVRFNISVPVSLIDGEALVRVVVKLEDGTIMDISVTDITITGYQHFTPSGEDETPIQTEEEDVTPVTEENQQTGDTAVAMFAVIIIAAMSAAFVFSRKKAF